MPCSEKRTLPPKAGLTTPALVITKPAVTSAPLFAVVP